MLYVNCYLNKAGKMLKKIHYNNIYNVPLITS